MSSVVLIMGMMIGYPGLVKGQGESTSFEVDPSASLAEAERLNQQITQLYQEGRYAEAIPLAERVLEIRETALGENHLDVATSLNDLAELYRLQSNYSVAETLYLRSLSIRTTVFGENHPLVANSLNNLATVYQAQGNYVQAETLFLRSLSITENELGENHPDVANSLNNLAALYQVQGNYSAAEPLYLRSLNIWETALGENHLSVALTLNNLAIFYQLQGKYSRAEPLFQRALKILETTVGENHLYVARSLNNLAALYRTQGNYSAAEPLLLEALSIREATLGESHPDVATTLNNLAMVYYSQGNYNEAEPLFLRSLSIYEVALGENHPSVAASLSNLATLYNDQGNYSTAESLFQRSLTIRETALGVNHPDVAQSLSGLAEVYRLQGNYDAATPLYIRALNTYETVFGENHPLVANSLNILAGFYQNQGNYSAAEPLYLRSLNIRETMLGEGHPEVAISLNNLAMLYYSQGNYGAVESLLTRSLSIYETTFGMDHPLVAIALQNLALFSWSSSHFSTAIEPLQQALSVEETNLGLILSLGSESRKQAYVATLAASTDFSISLNLQAAPNNSTTTRLALETILRRKGRVLEAITNNLQLLRQNLDADSQQLLEDLHSTRSQLAALRFQGLGNQSSEDYQAELARLETEAENFFNTLAQRSTEFRIESAPVTIAAVQAELPSNAILIEFFRYQPFNPGALQSEQWSDPRYAAYILHPDGTTHSIDLGKAEAIDQAITEYLKQLKRPSSTSVARAAARNLDELILQPIRPYFGSAQHLLISPDGQLNLIPFAALVDENDQYLVENYTPTTLASGRDLLKLQRDRFSQQPPVVVANPDFNTANSLVAQAPDTSNTRSANTQRSIDLATLDFDSLPGTQLEAEAIVPLLPNATLFTGANATEAALTQINAPSILHLATHGYFLNDVTPILPSSRGGDGTIEFVPAAMPPAQDDVPLSNENPLLRSGLALASFNPPRDEPGNNDGVLSALEVSSLNLYGTDLVVLSACETGVGDVVNGEGVYGLRRAFALAGAESLLMSLWKVDDYGTAELMRLYYDRLINQNEGRSEALRQVQLELLNAPAYEHPYYWAAFMLSGDWRPLNE